MQLRGAADLLLQFSLHSLLKTLQNQEVDCTLQQLEAGGVLLGMVKGQFFDVVFCAHHPGAEAPKHCRRIAETNSVSAKVASSMEAFAWCWAPYLAIDFGTLFEI